jgi:hypothetical protein
MVAAHDLAGGGEGVNKAPTDEDFAAPCIVTVKVTVQNEDGWGIIPPLRNQTETQGWIADAIRSDIAKLLCDQPSQLLIAIDPAAWPASDALAYPGTWPAPNRKRIPSE